MEKNFIYNEDAVIECLGEDIDKAEEILGLQKAEDEGYSDGCDDGTYTMYRAYENDSNGNYLVLYYNSEDYLVHDFKLINK